MQIFTYLTEHEVHVIAQAANQPGLVANRLHSTCQVFSDRALRSRHLAYGLIPEPVDPLVEQQRLVFRYAYAEIFEQLNIESMASGELSALSPGISAASIVGLFSEILVGPFNQLSAQSVKCTEPLLFTQTGQSSVSEFITLACQLVGLEPPK